MRLPAILGAVFGALVLPTAAQTTLSVPNTLSDAQPEVARPGDRPTAALDCAIRPSRVVEISSVVEGVLAEVFVRPGQSVAAGDLIARVDTDIAKADLANATARASAVGALRTAEARARAAGAQLSVQRRGYERKVVSRADYERARGEYAVAKEEVTAQQEVIGIAASDRARMEVILSKGEIRAPFAGIIGEALLDPSEATAGQAVAQLIVTDPMRVEVFAPLDAAENIRAGGDYVIVAGATSPVLLEPAFDYISPVADSSSQTIRVYYNLETDKVSPGFRCLLMPRGDAEAYLSATARRTN